MYYKVTLVLCTMCVVSVFALSSAVLVRTDKLICCADCKLLTERSRSLLDQERVQSEVSFTHHMADMHYSMQGEDCSAGEELISGWDDLYYT